MKGHIPRAFIDDLIARTDIVDLINSRVKLKKAGRDYQACCPFHHEKSPSFTVSRSKQFYHCFGCGAHGSAVNFLMEYDKLDFVEAIEEMAALQGLEIPYEKSESHSHRTQVSYQTKRNLYELMQDIAQYYRQLLPKSQPAQDYLQQRGLSTEIIERFAIGFVPDSFNTILARFGQSADDQKKLFDLGMLSNNERGRVYDRFRNRIMFPIRDRRGRYIAFGGRVMNDDKPKYLNSPESATYHKGNELYGLFEALQCHESPEKLLVVEGYMDVVALAQFGVDYAVAALGTATTSEQIQLLFRVTEHVVCCYDGDRAGRDAAWRALENALPYLEDGRQLKFIFLPDGEDPDSYIRRYGKSEFEHYIEQAQTLSEFLFSHLSLQADLSSQEGKLKLAALAMPLIGKIPGQMLRLYLRNLLASKLGVLDQSQLEQFLPANAAKAESAVQKPRKIERTPMRILIALLLQNPTLVRFVGDLSTLRELNAAGFELFYALCELCRTRVGITTGQILEYWRESEHFRPLEILSIWDHLIEEDKIEATFTETLRYFADQAKLKRMEQLSAKDRTDGLSQEEKLLYVKLLQERQQSNS